MVARRILPILIVLIIILLTRYASIPAISPTSLPTPGGSTDFVWDGYASRTFDDITNNQLMMEVSGKDAYLSVDMKRSRVAAIYMGESRPTSSQRLELINAWFSANRADTRYKSLFMTEWLFVVDGEEFWLPVQAVSAEHMQQTFNPGDPVDLLVVLLGANKRGALLEWLFVVNDVVSQQAVSQKSPSF